MATSTSPVPLAIIGVAYRAPGVGRKGLVEFLSEARSAFSLVPKDRFDHKSFYHNDSAKPGALSVKGAYFLPDDIYAFDAPFFNITPEEAASMDPQLREHTSTSRAWSRPVLSYMSCPRTDEQNCVQVCCLSAHLKLVRMQVCPWISFLAPERGCSQLREKLSMASKWQKIFRT